MSAISLLKNLNNCNCCCEFIKLTYSQKEKDRRNCFQHSNFLALIPTLAYEQRSHFIYLKSVKNFRSVEYSKLKFRCVEKIYTCFKISFHIFLTWCQMSFQVCLLFSFLIFMIYEKICFYEEIIQESEFINRLRCFF